MIKTIPQNSYLREHIDHYMFLNADVHSSFKHSRLHAFPGISPEIAVAIEGHYNINYQGERQNHITETVFGHIDHTIVVDTSPVEKMLIIKFKPKALASLLPFVGNNSIAMLRSQFVSPSTLFGCKWDNLIEHIRKQNNDNPTDILDDFFLQHLYKNNDHELVTEIATCDGETVSEILDGLPISASTLERHFKKLSGHSLKQFLRLKRFKTSLEYKYANPESTWSQLLHRYGYYDQSHYIQEVKFFTGYTPNQLLKTHNMIPIR